MRTPEQQHRNRHLPSRKEKPLSECWECQRERAICRSKRRLMTHDAVNEEAHRINVETDWQRMLIGYACCWCGFYHLTKAKPGTARWKRAEKRRRRWLAEQVSA